MAIENKADDYNNGEETEEIKKVDLDTILVEDIGQFGKYQFRILLLTVVLVMFWAFVAVEFVFSSARINTRCLIPECENLEPTTFSPPWILNAVPGTDGSVANCHRYEPVNYTTRTRECPAEWFNRDVVVGCSNYVYENTDSLVYHLRLACDEWRRSMIGTVQTIGGLLSMPITGFISDRWGRRVALCFNALNITWLGLMRYWINNYYAFLAVEILKTTLGGGGFACAYILVMELVGPKYRVPAGATVNTFFSIGQVILGLIAWAIPYWKNLILAILVPQLLFISYLWIMPESVRWYISKGRYEKAEEFLKNVSRVNQRDLSEQTLQALKENVGAEKTLNERKKKEKEPWLFTAVLQQRTILKRCCVSPLWWVSSALIYYGMTINAVNISGNSYVNFMAVTASEIPGYWIAVFLLDRIGRKPVLIGAYWTCAACQLAYILIPNGYYAVTLSVYLIGKLSIAMVVTSLYIYTAEIYPTRYRHSLLAFSSMVGRLGSIVAPLTPALEASLWHHLPSALFCASALIAGGLVFLTPETLGTRLPDTMEEAAHIAIKQNTD